MKHTKMFYILISCSILIFLKFAQNVCFPEVNTSAEGPFQGSVLIEFVDPSSEDLFQLSLKDGVRLVGQSKIKREGEERWTPVNEPFRGKYDEYKTRQKKIVSVLERNLNKNNISQLREIVTKDFDELTSDGILRGRVNFVDIHSQQDGTVLRNVLPSFFYPNPQLTYAVYGLFDPLLIDLNKLTIFPLPTDFKPFSGSLLRDPPTWSIDGSNIVLLKEKSTIKEGKEYYPRKQLIVFDVIERKIIFRTETKSDVDSIAWSPDSKSLAVIGHSYHFPRLISPSDWLARLLGHGPSDHTYYLELFHIAGREHREFLLLRDSRSYKISYMVWIE